MQLSGTGPASALGLVAINAPVPPRITFGCDDTIDILSAIVLGSVQGSTFQVPVPVANSSTLLGVRLHAQVWFVDPVALFPLEATNGVALRIGY